MEWKLSQQSSRHAIPAGETASRLGRSRLDAGKLIRRIASTVIVLSLLLIAWSLPVQSLAAALQHWSERLGPLAPLVYLATVVLFTCLLIPTWPLPFLAGALFGPVWGAVIASLSPQVATLVSAGLARALRTTAFRERIEASPRLRALEHAVRRSNWKIIAAVRVSHFLPFGMQNYAFGLMRVPFGTLILTTWLVTLPGTILQAYVGHLGFQGMEAWRGGAPLTWTDWGLRIAGIGLIAAAVVYIGHLARSGYRSALEHELAHAVEASERVSRRRGVTWGTVLLLVIAVLMATAGGTAFVQREAIRHDVGRWAEEAVTDATTRTTSNGERSIGIRIASPGNCLS